MKEPNECQSINEVRLEIDEIDNAIIRLIAKRFSFIQEIVKYKSSIDEVYAKDRFGSVISKRREFAANHNLDPDVIEKMYRIMMNYFIEEQLELFKKRQK
jgi:isochorismate pyruvate lyase